MVGEHPQSGPIARGWRSRGAWGRQFEIEVIRAKSHAQYFERPTQKAVQVLVVSGGFSVLLDLPFIESNVLQIGFIILTY